MEHSIPQEVLTRISVHMSGFTPFLEGLRKAVFAQEVQDGQKHLADAILAATSSDEILTREIRQKLVSCSLRQPYGTPVDPRLAQLYVQFLRDVDLRSMTPGDRELLRGWFARELRQQAGGRAFNAAQAAIARIDAAAGPMK